MRKLLFFFAVSTLAVLPTIADDKDRGSDDLIGASARLLPIDDSGIKAKALFIDSGAPFNILVVSASATGLDPTKNYISLLYDNASVPTGPH